MRLLRCGARLAVATGFVVGVALVAGCSPAVWFYASDMPDGRHRSSVTGVYADGATWVVAVDVYLPRDAEGAGYTPAMVPAAGVVLVRVAAPDAVTVVVQ
ncbi:MAG: hypothetical protein LBE08_06970 [Bifidobacteriaceae bacterium]|jgi:hypothetical protein|nr:hypothetical protein [Bifidobacteriaceae bacterium]